MIKRLATKAQRTQRKSGNTSNRTQIIEDLQDLKDEKCALQNMCKCMKGDYIAAKTDPDNLRLSAFQLNFLNFMLRIYNYE